MFFLWSFLLVVADQISKYFVVENIELHEKITLIPGFFDFTHVRNPGSAFSILADRSWGIYVLISISSIACAGILYLLYRAGKKKMPFLFQLALTFILAGAAGNLIDRIRYKSVVDFFQFTFGSYVFPIFNVADICVVCGTIGLILLLLINKNLSADDIFDLFPDRINSKINED